MRLKGRQARFLASVLGAWIAARAMLLLPMGADGGRLSRPGAPPVRQVSEIAERIPTQAGGRFPGDTAPTIRLDQGERAFVRPVATHRTLPALLRLTDASPMPAEALAQPSAQASSPPLVDSPFPPAPAPASSPRRIEAQAYLFVRPGSGQALASGSALGGSQAAARIAVPIDPAGRIAAAARFYAPLNGKGAEAALGIDWRPAPGVPLRVSIERRQRLDPAGRRAWSGYAAGGFYRALPGALRFDGYAQAGVVGVHARDLFADGALRIERAMRLGQGEAGIGAGLWSAAQPGASRIDAGPRAAMRLPVADHTLSLAIEGRFRVAGDARPGSGVAVTLAADL
ncbi:hypothetical protein Q4F19_16275 [Sphingomonas sp. BIUV-7]|uniref:Uncharacterized protein n=1 Tax=Sphingomonas natans TaxID=3063330 RepID=A0ABT8YDD3_9SPHN|nr:hypothetical protein [Sphingomonas sp. BIUV-7]MDO6415947.1 hypothetical protein [Sphingomonas sp. BIUV-7]